MLKTEKEKSLKLQILLDTSQNSDTDSGIGNNSLMSVDQTNLAQKISALEMREINERQKAEHFKNLHESVSGQLKILEKRNQELEDKFEQVEKLSIFNVNYINYFDFYS